MPITIPIDEPETALILSPAQSILERAYEVEIDSAAMYEVAGAELRGITAALTKLDDDRMAITRPLDEAKARLIAKYKPARDALERAREIYRDGISRWNARVQQEMREAARVAEAAERERQRKAAEEQAIAADAAAKKAAALTEKAAKLEAAGKIEQAATLRQAAVVEAVSANTPEPLAPVAVVVPQAPKAQGVSVAQKYDAECFDILAFAAYVVAHPMFASCLQANPTALRQQATSLRENFALPGCRLIKSSVVRARA